MAKYNGVQFHGNLSWHSNTINRMAWAPRRLLLAAASEDHTVSIWNVKENIETPALVMDDHQDAVFCVTWSPDGNYLASSSRNGMIILWDIVKDHKYVLCQPNGRAIYSVHWSPDGTRLVSTSTDSLVRIWELGKRKPPLALIGHSKAVYCAAWSKDGSLIASGSQDGTVRLWEAETGRTYQIYEGHNGAVYSLAWSPDDKSLLASASEDSTIRLWGSQMGILEGHTNMVVSVDFSSDGKLLASKSLDKTVRLWSRRNWETIQEIAEEGLEDIAYWTSGIAFHPQRAVLATLNNKADDQIRIWSLNPDMLFTSNPSEQSIQYTNAKVVLVGATGVGKTQLANVLTLRKFQEVNNTSTTGVNITAFGEQQVLNGRGQAVPEIRETLMWDFAGQHVYRQVHQLHLRDVAVALVVFSASSPTDSLAEVRFWARALDQAQRTNQKRQPANETNGKVIQMKKFLVAGRIDVAKPGLNDDEIEKLKAKLKFDHYFATSAQKGTDIPELRNAIERAIDWEALPKARSPELFQHIKDFIGLIKEQANDKEYGNESYLLLKADELYDLFTANNPKFKETDDLYGQFKTCINLMEARGLIRRFRFGDLILLKPELLDLYASAILDEARDSDEGLGLIREKDIFNAPMMRSKESRVADPEIEKLLLLATVEDLLDHEIALRDVMEEDVEGAVNEPVLVFPAQLTRRRPQNVKPDRNTVIFEFEGTVSHIYAKLAVRLWRSQHFSYKDMYLNTAVFTITPENRNGRVHLHLDYKEEDEGSGKLTLRFENVANDNLRFGLENYVYVHLQREALANSVKRIRVIACPQCGTVVSDEIVRLKKQQGSTSMICPVCENRFELDTSFNQRLNIFKFAAAFDFDRRADKQRQIEVAAYTRLAKAMLNDYDVFLSYFPKDETRVRHVADNLKNRGIHFLPEIDDWEAIEPEEQIDLITGQRKPALVFVGHAQGLSKEQKKVCEIFRRNQCRIIAVALPHLKKQVHAIDGFKHFIDLRDNETEGVENIIQAIHHSKR
jgi:WD40 repeat protein/transcription elongation factor Elf1